MEEMVTITKTEYDNLKEDRGWLRCLEAAGIDNWEGYDQAIDIKDRKMQKAKAMEAKD